MGENPTVIFFTGLPRVTINTRGLREKRYTVFYKLLQISFFANLLSDQTVVNVINRENIMNVHRRIGTPNLRRCVFLEIYLHFKAIPVAPLLRESLSSLYSYGNRGKEKKKKEQARKTSRAP